MSTPTSPSPRPSCRPLVPCDGGSSNQNRGCHLGMPLSLNWSPTNIRTMMYSASLDAIMGQVTGSGSNDGRSRGKPRPRSVKRQITAAIFSGSHMRLSTRAVCVWWQSGLVALAATKYVTQPQRHYHSCDLSPVAASRVISLASTRNWRTERGHKEASSLAALFLLLVRT